MHKRRFIVHVDMDAFFAAIEQRDNPAYRSRPVIVGADPKGGRGRGVVSACSYEARKFGIHSAMPISVAWRKCPDAVFLPVDMEKYESVSNLIYEILYSFSPDIEPISIDEAFLDITQTNHLFGGPLETCLKIKERIKSVSGLTASVGLAPTKMAAKIASDLKKPDGLVEVSQEKLLEFLHPLDVSRIWGLGKKCADELSKIGIRTIGQLARQDPLELCEIFGKNGFHFWQLANGIDDREVIPAYEARSVSNELTFDQDTSDLRIIEGALMSLCEKVSGRLREEGLRCRTATLKIRLEGFITHTRSATLDHPTNFADVLYKEIKHLYNNDFYMAKRRVRLLGVKASALVPAGHKSTLFDGIGEEKQELVHTAIDRIRSKFGRRSIYRATSAGVLN
ncbi:MAG: DNA polymerase IV [Candidatus Omnitrophica bacterium]|nr:DNA polymerase IV [Candidatus Omnitrophota bacterium]MCM8790332.1 DNA polymerase IV [Candidatus Omnitrophota bacterium]